MMVSERTEPRRRPVLQDEGLRRLFFVTGASAGRTNHAPARRTAFRYFSARGLHRSKSAGKALRFGGVWGRQQRRALWWAPSSGSCTWMQKAASVSCTRHALFSTQSGHWSSFWRVAPVTRRDAPLAGPRQVAPFPADRGCSGRVVRTRDCLAWLLVVQVYLHSPPNFRRSRGLRAARGTGQPAIHSDPVHISPRREAKSVSPRVIEGLLTWTCGSTIGKLTATTKEAFPSLVLGIPSPLCPMRARSRPCGRLSPADLSVPPAQRQLRYDDPRAPGCLRTEALFRRFPQAARCGPRKRTPRIIAISKST